MRSVIAGKASLLYVKLPAYLRLWYIATHGTPVVLGEYHPARMVMEVSIHPTARDESGVESTNNRSTLTSRMYNKGVATGSIESEQWLPIVLPEKVVRSGEEVDVDDTWDMYYADRARFKEGMAGIFWNAVASYVCRAHTLAVEQRRIFRIGETLQRFCGEHGIPYACYEALRRQYFRKIEESQRELAVWKSVTVALHDERLKQAGEGVRHRMLAFLDKNNY